MEQRNRSVVQVELIAVVAPLKPTPRAHKQIPATLQDTERDRWTLGVHMAKTMKLRTQAGTSRLS